MSDSAGQQQFVKFTPDRLLKYKKAGYRIVGKNKHSGVEICRWTKSVMKGERNCYKGVYGIGSHRCVQMTPTLDFCSFSCKFCWRTFGKDRFKSENKWDSPKEVLDAAIAAQRELLNGWKGNPKTTLQRYDQAMDPVHVAISLDGEPTLYPHLPEFIKEIKNRGMTAFLVTNGTMPNRLKELIEKDAQPTNLYISVYATNPEDYKKITNSFVPDAFERVVESLKLMRAFKESRTIFRMTLVKGLNLKDAEGFAKLIKLANPKFIEFKGYTWTGESQKRLEKANMPQMPELEEFAEKIQKLTGYAIKHRDNISRVIVFVKDDDTWKWNFQQIAEQNRRIAALDASKIKARSKSG
jgi:tRNA wybutosine-synthesizing protein 1